MPKLFKNGSPVGRFTFLFVLLAAFSLISGVASLGLLQQDAAVYAQDDEGDAVDQKLDTAENDTGEGGTVKGGGESYLVWYIKALGPIFAPAFAVCSIIFVTLVVMNWMSINRKNIMPQELIDQFRAKLEEKEYQEAYEIAKVNESPQAKILAAGLAKMSAGYDSAQQSMADVAEEEVTRLEQKLGYIALIGGIAPMLGLLGTVYGMVQSFQVIAVSGTAPQASELAGGISTALITTEVGLFIAIPAMILYEFFRNKLALLVLELTVQTENLMSRFKG